MDNENKESEDHITNYPSSDNTNNLYTSNDNAQVSDDKQNTQDDTSDYKTQSNESTSNTVDDITANDSINSNSYETTISDPAPHSEFSTKTKKKDSKASTWIAISIVCMVIAVASICVMLFNTLMHNNDNKNNDTNQPNVTDKATGNNELTDTSDADIKQSTTPDHQTTTNSDNKLDEAGVIDKLLPSVVYIEITTQRGQGCGTGVIMSDDGYIITCAHVISEASTIKVMTNDEKSYDAKLIGYDESSDIGVIKIEGTFTAAEFGDSDKIVAGDEVIAIGSPYSDMFFQTATKGMVSAVRKNLTFSSLNLTLDVIQHDAAINAGNSGGPLVNMYGQVIGINSIKMSGDFENIGFAIQINEAIEVAKQTMVTGTVKKPVLGITGQTYGTTGGVIIATVSEGSGAADAGLQAYDVITKVDGQRISTFKDLSSILAKKAAGDTLDLTIFREGSLMDVKVTLKSAD